MVLVVVSTPIQFCVGTYVCCAWSGTIALQSIGRRSDGRRVALLSVIIIYWEYLVPLVIIILLKSSDVCWVIDVVFQLALSRARKREHAVISFG